MNNDTLTVLFEKKSLEIKNPFPTSFEESYIEESAKDIISGLKVMKKDVDESVLQDSSLVSDDTRNETIRIYQPNLNKEAPIVNSFIKTISKNVVDYYDEEYVNSIEYDGIVDEIFEDGFSATLKQRNTEKYIDMIIMYDELKYKSDIKIITVGSRFFAIIGKKTRPFLSIKGKFERGTQTKIFDVFFRREKKLSKKEMKEADELSSRWFELLNT